MKCRWDAAFQQPVALANLNGGYHDLAARPTADELTLYDSRIVTSGANPDSSRDEGHAGGAVRESFGGE